MTHGRRFRYKTVGRWHQWVKVSRLQTSEPPWFQFQQPYSLVHPIWQVKEGFEFRFYAWEEEIKSVSTLPTSNDNCWKRSNLSHRILRSQNGRIQTRTFELHLTAEKPVVGQRQLLPCSMRWHKEVKRPELYVIILVGRCLIRIRNGAYILPFNSGPARKNTVTVTYGGDY